VRFVLIEIPRNMYRASFLSLLVFSLVTVVIAASPHSRERGFTKKEAQEKVGRRVHVRKCSSLSTIGKRRDDPDGLWMDLTVGERGTVKRMEQVAPNEYYLIVFWDEPREQFPYRSYFRKAGRFSVYKKCLAEE